MRTSLRTHLHARLWLILAILAGVFCFLLLPEKLGYLQRLLIGWNVLAWLYLASQWFRMLHAKTEHIEHIARIQDESASLVLSVIILACLVSVLAILLELSSLKSLTGTPRVLHIVLTATTLIVSWTLLPSSFAIHYAHHHYLHRSKNVVPLRFPENPQDPNYWDFLYYAFTIAVASQTADVATGSRDIRRITLLQSVVSFVFNLAILGLSVNVAAGLLS